MFNPKLAQMKVTAGEYLEKLNAFTKDSIKDGTFDHIFEECLEQGKSPLDAMIWIQAACAEVFVETELETKE